MYAKLMIHMPYTMPFLYNHLEIGSKEGFINFQWLNDKCCSKWYWVND